MKKRILFLASVTLLSFIFVMGASAQEKVQDTKKVAKAKTELTKKEIPAKCAACPSLTKCLGEDAKGAVAKTDLKGKEEAAACCSGEATPAETKKTRKKVKVAKLK